MLIASNHERRRRPPRGELAHRPRVLLAEDDPELRSTVASALRDTGLDVVELRAGNELLDGIERMIWGGDLAAIDLVISDQCMPACSGLDALAALRRHDWRTPFILITAFGDERTRREAERLGAAGVFDKPFAVEDLCTAALYYAREA